jgi:hypothetical protein
MFGMKGKKQNAVKTQDCNEMHRRVTRGRCVSIVIDLRQRDGNHADQAGGDIERHLAATDEDSIRTEP